MRGVSNDLEARGFLMAIPPTFGALLTIAKVKSSIALRVGKAPVKKILRNGRIVTIFTVGTDGMFDQRLVGDKDLPRPAQWHRVTVHNEMLGAYAVQQLMKKSGSLPCTKNDDGHILELTGPRTILTICHAIICGKVGQALVKKILRNGRIVTIFTVGTDGMFDQRLVGDKDLPRPAQWHRVAVHNEMLGAYAVQQLMKKYGSVTSSIKL
ncbi:unnamed protein product [Fraxinus pennsylvanica]|uniref:Uncharacterized protein n=1 Tax=Fraxinus pennsylvanica TaxID=56036 RepID=A0AAD2E5C6_9LAMI|nr:unnamed protein product [Fraxinus pennsylvanica]